MKGEAGSTSSHQYSFKYNQQDATSHNILYYCQCSTYLGRFLRPSSGAQELHTQHLVPLAWLMNVKSSHQCKQQNRDIRFLICRLFNNAVRYSDYILSNCQMNEEMDAVIKCSCWRR